MRAPPRTAISFLLAAFGLLAWSGGCGNGSKPAYVPNSRAGTEVYKKPADTAGGPAQPVQPDVVPAAYAPPADPESHRIEMRTNEYRAYETLRSITVAQKHYTRDITPVLKDLDGDGLGEFCYLLEICGISNVQTPSGKGRARTLGAQDWRWFRPSDAKGNPFFWISAPDEKREYYWTKQNDFEFLVFKFDQGRVWHIDSAGIAQRDGYLFILYLPGKETAEVASGEVPDGDPALADARERRFAAYCWPVQWNVTGRRAFFTDRFEAVWASWNLTARYEGRSRIPAPEAAFDAQGKNPANLEADPGIAFDDSPTLERTGVASCDGEIWKIFGERRGIRRKPEEKWTRDDDVEDFKKDGGTKQPWWGE